TGFGLIASRRPRSPALVVVLLCMAVAPLVAIRHLPLFATAAGVLAGEHLADALRRWLPEDRMMAGLVGPWRWLEIGPVVAAGVLVVLAWPHFTCLRIDPGTGLEFPARAVALLQQNRVEANLAVHFDW